MTIRPGWDGRWGAAGGAQEGPCPPPHLLAVCSSQEPTSSEEGQDAPIYTEFDEDFEEEPASPIGHCVAIYHFEGGQRAGQPSLLPSPSGQAPAHPPSGSPGSSEGTISMAEGEDLSLIEEDKGDGWTRVRRKQGGEGYVPTSYLRVSLN